MTPWGAVRGGPGARARHGHTGRLLGAGARWLGHPRRLAGASWRLMLTGVAWRLSVLGVAHALTRAHHTGAPGSGAHAGMLTRAPGLVLTGMTRRLSVLRMAHALSRAPGSRSHARMLAHGHPHSDIVH